MNDFEFPTNIKQIGSISDKMKIYIEDYAYSYLQQYAMAGGFEERLCYLVGRRLIIDKQQVLFINGVLQGTHTTTEKDMPVFTEKSRTYALEQIEKYFKGLDIVGWTLSQPGYGVYLNSNSVAYHVKHFKEKEEVFFVLDPIEKVNSFYIWNDEKDNITEIRGYFIYYDKNRGMHEYMLNNKISKFKSSEGEEVLGRKDEEMSDKPEIKQETINETIKESPKRKDYIEKVEEFRSRPRKKTYARGRNAFAPLTAVLIIICVITATGLVKNDGRMKDLEGEISELSKLLVQMKDTNSKPVFAPYEEKEEKAEVNVSQEVITKDKAEIITEDGNKVLFEDVLAEQNKVLSPEEFLKKEEDKTTEEPVKQPEEPKKEEEAKKEENNSDVATTDNTKTAKKTVPEKYIVQQGDSLISISLRFYGDKSMIQKIMDLNDMDDPNKIFFGKVLKMPQIEEQ